MRRNKRESTDTITLYKETRCPACGHLARYRKAEDAVLSFQCKKCTTKFQITVRRPDQATLEKQFIDSDIGTGQDPPQRIMEADPDGPNIAPIRTSRPGSRPASRPRPGIVHK